MRRALLLVVCVLASVCAGAETDRLESGLALLDESVARRASDPARSEGLARDAAALISGSLDEVGHDNPAAQRALGNAWLLAGELGHAVLAYRRAEVAAPGDPIVRASLEHARSLLEARPAPAAGVAPGWRNAVRAWSGWQARAWMFWACVGGFGAACLALAARVVSVLPSRVTTPAVALGVAALAGLGVLGAGPLTADGSAAVVVTPATARTGPHAELYPPALDRPLPAGTEVRILETRDAWAFCAAGAERVWLPAAAVARVHPEALATERQQAASLTDTTPSPGSTSPTGDAKIASPTPGPGRE